MRFIALLILALVTGCSKPDTGHAINTALLEGTGVTVTLSLVEEGASSGKWRAKYIFAQPQTAMLFSRSSGNYRAGTWTSVDPNARFEHLNGFDAILFETPSLSAEFIFQPYTQTVPKDYTPFIPFSDGGMAVFTGQFDLMPATDSASIAALHGDIQKWQGEQPHLGVRLVSTDTMILGGEVVHAEAVDISFGQGSYIYVGDAKITTGADFSGVIDSGLPSWLSNRFDEDLSKIFDGYRMLWGEGLPDKSTVLFSFRGYGHKGYSNKGGALGNMLALETSGENLREESPEILKYTHWFFAHEAAHLFQNRNGSWLDDSRQAWITEGAANAMANNVLRYEGLADDTYIMTEYAKEFKQCSQYLQTGKISEAAQTGQFDILYACGDLMAQITDGALENHSLFAFWNELIKDDNATSQYGAESYFALMLKLGADTDVVEDLRTLASERIEDPDTYLADLMRTANLAPQFDASGTLISLKFP